MPKTALRIVLVQPPSYDWVTPSNGLALLQAHLKSAGFSPIIVDSSMRVRKALLARLGRGFKEHAEYHAALAGNPKIVAPLLEREVERILALKPDVVAFAVLTYTEKWSLEMAEAIKSAKPSCRVVFGGPQCLRENSAFDHIRSPSVDAVMLGEADVSAVAFLKALEKGGSAAAKHKGVLTKKGGKIIDGGDSDAVTDMDSLPFLDFSGFPMEDYEGDTIYITTTRSCVRRCGFCTHFLMQKAYGVMSPERTLAEIKHQMSVYPKRRLVVFSDSLVNGDIGRLSRLADLLLDFRLECLGRGGKQADFAWTGMAILHPTMTPALLRKLYGSGCRQLSYGLESGSQKVIDLMDKRFKVSDAAKVVRDSHAAGVRARLYVQCGFPGETEDDFRRTLDFFERNAASIDQVSISFCEVYRGSDLDLRPAHYGIKTPIEDRTRWVSIDGSNTYDVRMDRCRRASQAAQKLGIPVVEVFSSKLGF